VFIRAHGGLLWITSQSEQEAGDYKAKVTAFEMDLTESETKTFPGL